MTDERPILCDQPMCDQPATRIVQVNGKAWQSCERHQAITRLPPLPIQSDGWVDEEPVIDWTRRT